MHNDELALDIQSDIEYEKEKCDSTDFRSELVRLLNKFSKENGSNTPDFILRDYLCDCLKSFDKATKRRSEWYQN